MSTPETDAPELSCGDVAELLDAVGTTAPSEEAADLLRRCIEEVPELRELWLRLAQPTAQVFTGFEAVKAVLTAEMEVAWAEGERVVRQLLPRVDGGAELLAELDRMAASLGGRRANEGWMEGVLGIYQEVDLLLKRRGWTDPRQVLDPTGEVGVDVERLSKVCFARLRDPSGSEAEKKRLLWVLSRLNEYASKKAKRIPR